METLTSCSTSTATILACQKIARAFRENIYELSSIRKEWDLKYATSLNVWISDTIEKHYADCMDGIEYDKYREWHDIMIAALRNLKILRASLKVDYRNEKQYLKDFFERTGYNEYFNDAKDGDHLSLCRFLQTFRENLDPDTRRKIIARGTSESVIGNILGASERIGEFQHCFELLEGETELDNYGRKEVSEIYKTIRDICRIAIAYYHFDPVQKEKFNFYKVMVNL